MTDPNRAGPGDLSFDKAIPVASPAGAPVGLVCVSCRRALTDSYHTANGQPVCENCRTILERATRGVTEPAPLVKAIVFGIGAAIAGAIVYWAVMRFLKLEIGLVAILTGWMVGKAVRAGADKRGGRVLQVVSALLVYLSVSMAYLPFVLGSADGSVGAIGLLYLLASLPIISILGSLPGGLISALIIGFGMMQAWQLTATPHVAFQGPFRVGGATAA